MYALVHLVLVSICLCEIPIYYMHTRSYRYKMYRLFTAYRKHCPTHKQRAHIRAHMCLARMPLCLHHIDCSYRCMHLRIYAFESMCLRACAGARVYVFTCIQMCLCVCASPHSVLPRTRLPSLHLCKAQVRTRWCTLYCVT